MKFAILDTEGFLLRIEVADDAPSVASGEKVHAMTPADEALASATNAPKRVRMVEGILESFDTRTLSQAKDDRWGLVKAARALALDGTFESGGLVFDCTPENITPAAIAALLAQAAGNGAWSKDWVLADNSIATMNATQVLAMASACDEYIGSLWVISADLFSQINAATTIAAVDAITWP